MDLTSLLAEILGDYKPFNNGELYFSCPFCHHHSKKLAVNVTKKAWHCWICGVRGKTLLSLFKKLDVTKSQLSRLRELVNDSDISAYKMDQAVFSLKLPPEYHPLWIKDDTYAYLHALKYLKSRGISGLDILRYKIGYCNTGEYAGRIIIPSYDANNTLNYFVSRAFYESSRKYKNPPISKNIVAFENQINWSEPVILCEGVFDAIAIRRNAIPLLGKHVSSALLAALLNNSISMVYVLLDSDATINAMEIEQQLHQYNIAVKRVVLDGKDPSELGFETTWNCIENHAITTEFKDYIKQKMSGGL